jgi:competence protein ComEC
LFLVKPYPLSFGKVRVTLLDVGQGLSAVIETQDQLMVYDTGPKFSDRFNAGDAIILPYLRQVGASNIDVLVLSHGDSDHAGGLDALTKTVDVKRFLNGASRKIKSPQGEACVAGTRWESSGVKFEIIFPDADQLDLVDNNGSCVVRIEASGRVLLLTGDIEKKAERFLINSRGLNLGADVMLIPHHGSKTSSTEAFIDRVGADVAINAVGFGNRYRLPNKQVIQRYLDRHIAVWDTARHGAISLTLSSQGVGKPVAYRLANKRFWHSDN